MKRLVFSFFSILCFGLIVFIVATNCYASNYPDTVIETIPVGHMPQGIIASPDGDFIYVANRHGQSLSKIETMYNTVVDTISVGLEPYGMSFSPDGQYLYIANWRDNSVYKLRVTDNFKVDEFDTDWMPEDIEITADGLKAYVTFGYLNKVSVFELVNNTKITDISVGNMPLDLTITHNGDFAYVPNRSSNTVSVIQTSNDTIVDTISVGNIPHNSVISPDGEYLYVTIHHDDEVAVIDTNNHSVQELIPVGDLPCGMDISHNGEYVYVSNCYDDTVSVIQTSTNTVVETITVGDYPHDVAVTPDGKKVYVTNMWEDTVSVIASKIIDFETFTESDQGSRFGVDIDEEFDGLDWAYDTEHKIATWGSFTVQDKNAIGGNDSEGNVIPGANGSDNWVKVRASSVGKGAKITRCAGECFEFFSMKLYTQDHPAFINEIDVTWRACDGMQHSALVHLTKDTWIEVTNDDLGIEGGTLLKAMWFNGAPTNPNGAKFGLDDYELMIVPEP